MPGCCCQLQPVLEGTTRPHCRQHSSHQSDCLSVPDCGVYAYCMDRFCALLPVVCWQCLLACACCGCAPATCAACAILLAHDCCVLLSATGHLVAGYHACMYAAGIECGGTILWYVGVSCPATHKPVTPAPAPLAICQCSGTALNLTCFRDRGAMYATRDLGSWQDCCTNRAPAPWGALVRCPAGATSTVNIGKLCHVGPLASCVMGLLLFRAWRPAPSQHASRTAWGPL